MKEMHSLIYNSKHSYVTGKTLSTPSELVRLNITNVFGIQESLLSYIFRTFITLVLSLFKFPNGSYLKW